MNIKRAKDEIKNTIEAYLERDEYGAYEVPVIRQRPVLLIGPPGVGKTQIMRQIAMECGVGLVSYTITHHTRQSAVGLPFIAPKRYGGKEYSATEYTMSEIVASLYDKMEETGWKEGILFIDEINCVSETLAPTMLQFLQCKTFGNHRIPEGWVIAAAGNPPEFNKSVREFDVVTLDRIKLIYVEADFEVWKEYAYKENIHPAIISYLEARKQNFCRIETTVDGKYFATPRGWEDLSCLIRVYEKLEKKMDREVIGQYIQYPEIAKDFANYLELYYKYQDDYQIGEILDGVIKESLCNRVSSAPFDEKLSVIGLLLSCLSNGFLDVLAMEERVKQIHGFLTERREAILGAHSLQDGLGILRDGILGIREDLEKRKEAGLLSRGEERAISGAINELEVMERSLIGLDRGWDTADSSSQAKPQTSRTDLWEQIKSLFGEKNDIYQSKVDFWGKRLEYGFDFMEAAFGDSQEMVIFVTELNTNYYCTGFLQQYPCDRYYQYNERLLFNRQEDQIAKRIALLEK